MTVKTKTIVMTNEQLVNAMHAAQYELYDVLYEADELPRSFFDPQEYARANNISIA